MPDNHENQQNFKRHGFQAASAANGSFQSFKIQIKALYHNLASKDIDATNEKHKKAREEIAIKEEEIATKKGLSNNIKEEKIPIFDKRVNEVDKTLDELKNNPEGMHLEEPDYTKIYLGGTLLFFITAYLWVFYTSAVYSAVYGGADSIANAMFNGNALIDAFAEGSTAVLFVVLVPLVFLGLGYIIHLFEEQGNKQAKFSVFGLAFIVDAILAYVIDLGICENKQIFDPNQICSKWSPFIHAEFWLIIFFGFLAYVIWGIILSPVIDNIKKLNKISYKQQSLIKERKKYSDQKKEKEDEVFLLEDSIVALNSQIEHLRQSFTKYVLSLERFKPGGDAFYTGWSNWMVGAEKSQDEQDKVANWYQSFLEQLSKGGDVDINFG